MLPTPETRYARSDAGYVAYQVFGDGPAAIMFITSWAQNLDVMWDEPALARYLERLGSFGRTLVFDKRGTGVSDPAGTILTSSTVKDLVLGSGIEFIDRGPRQLKGVPDTWSLFQVIRVP